MKHSRLILAGSILAAIHAQAATIDWKDTSGDTVWATGSNWVGEVAPADDLATDIARFNQTSYAFQPNAGTTSIRGIEIGDGTTATAVLTLGGTALSIGAGGITVFANAGAATISAPVTAGATQIWANNSTSLLTLSGAITYTSGVTLNGGNIQLNNLTNTGTGGLTLGAGKLIVGTSNASNLIAGAAASVLTLSGGTIATSAAGSGGSRTFGNDLHVNGAVQFNDGNNTGHTYTFNGANQTFNGAVLSARDNNGVSFVTNPAVLTGNLTVNTPGAGVAASFTFSGGLTVNGAASANRTMTLNNGTASVALSGALAGTASGQTITLAGTGTNNVVGAISSGANTPGLIVNGAPTGVFSFSAANTFGGGVTVSGGITEIQNDTGFGTNTLTLSGGSLRPNTANDRTLANAVAINGPITFGSSTASGRAITFSGNTNISNTPTVTFGNTANSSGTIFSTGTTTLGTDATFTGAGNYRFINGLVFSSNRQLTLNTTGNGIFRGALTGSSNTLTLAGNGTNISFGDGTAPAITGSTGGIIVNGPTVSFATSTSAFTGGVTATSGIVRIGTSSTVVANAVTGSGIGLGTLTANGGTITGNSNSARTVNNNLAIPGDSTFGTLGDTTNTASLTFDPTGVTGGTITLSGARTLTVNVGTTFTGPITGGTGLTVKGVNTLTLTNAGSASTLGNVAIGDNLSSGSLGGSLGVSSQNAMGSGTYALNYGGRLTYNAVIASSNVINVNNGGTLTLNGTPVTSLITLASGSAIGAGGAVALTQGTTVSLPFAGVLLNTAANAVTVTGTFPAFTGTVAFGGSGAGSITTSAVATTSGAQSLVLNQTGGGQTTLNGLTLGGNLTVAGSGNSGVSGTIAQSNQLGGMLGLVGEAGVRSITVNMAATGIASITNLSTFSGGLTINSGILSVNLAGSASNTTTKAFTNLAAISLNGGVFRTTNHTNNTQAMADSFSIGANGGTIESMQTNNGPRDQSFSGAITGSGPLNLRYGGTGTNSSPVVLAPTSASAYNGAITLATTSGRGRVQFNSNSLAAIAPGGITVPAGTVFGVDAIATLTGNIAKFNLNPDSILAMDNITAGNLDLSTLGGTGRDIRLGGSPTFSGSPTLTPFGSTYNFTPSGLITINVTNLLTGGKNLDVRAGVIAPGAYSVANNTLSINNAQNYTGTTTVAGIIHNSIIGSGVSGPILNISGNLSAAGAASITRGATLQLLGAGGSGQLSGTSGITVMGSGIVQDGDPTAASNNSVTDRIRNTATLTLGGADGGGTLRIAFPAATFTHAQTLASLTVSPGSNTVSTVNTAAGTLALSFSGAAGSVYSRNAGSAVSISLPTTTAIPTAFSAGVTTVSVPTGLTNIYIGMPVTGTGLALGTNVASYNSGTGALGLSQATSAVNSATALTYVVNNGTVNFTNAPAGSPNVIGGILAGAFINSSDFVAAAAGAIAPPIYTYQSAAGSWTAGQNISSSVNTGITGTTSGNLAINSLRNGASGNGTVTVGASGSDSLTISSGMILHTPNNSLAINGPGTFTSGNGQDISFNVQQNTVTVAAQITGGLSLTKVGGGTLTLSNTGNAIGDVYALGGTTVIGAAGALATGTTRTINLLGGTVQFAVGGAYPSTTSINVGAAGGSINANVNGSLSFAGNVTLNGAMTISSPSGGNPTIASYTGTLSGPGLILIGKQSDGKNFTTFTGDSPNWSGGIQFNVGNNSASGSSHLRFAPAVAGYSSAGTGPINLVGGNTPSGIYFDTTAAGSTTFGNDIVNNFTSAPIVAWGLSIGLGTVGTVNTTTLSGKFTGNQGLLLQGYASSDSLISELVLSGTVSVSGTSGGYSYGTSTFAQNFNNGQGGITLGVTQYRTLTQQGAGNIGLVDLPSGQALNGAEGFVRFSGGSSFILGAAGPGYISAIRKAGGGQDGRFGYLLTSGSAYAIPEGKSFLIGSLGTGTQQYGTLGVAGGGSATLLGGAKAAAGQTLAGFTGGDINIHANAAADTQSLNLLARAAADTLVLGGIAAPIVFTPTYGDSGYSSAMTLLSKRTGATTLNKIGAGTVDLAAVAYTHTDGTGAGSGFSWNVTEGTLQTPDGASLASSVTLSNASTLKASGTVGYANAVTLGTGGGRIDTNGNTVTLSGAVSGAGNTLTKTGNGTLNFAVGSAQSYAALVAQQGTTNVNSAVGSGMSSVSVTGSGTSLKLGSVNQTLSSLSIGAGSTVTFVSGLASFGGEGDGGKAPGFVVPTAGVVPEPGSLALLLVGALGLAARRRRA